MTQEQDALLQRAGYFDIAPSLSCFVDPDSADDNPVEEDFIKEDFIEDDEDEDFDDEDEDETVS
jgi:hypothetical protein